MECSRDGRRAPSEGGAVIGTDGVEGGDGGTQWVQRRLEVAVPARHFAHRLDGGPGAVLGERETGVDDGGGRRTRGAGRGDGRREDSGGLPAVRGLVGPGDIQRLGVRGLRVCGVDQTDRRHVHRRTAVDDVSGAGLARIDMAVVQPCDDPLLGEEDPLERQRVRLQLRDPAGRGDQFGHQMVGDRVRVEVVAHRPVHPYQCMGHQGVVGDVSVALVVGGDGAGRTPVVAVPRADDAADPPAVTGRDLLGGPALDRTAERVADRRADERSRDPFIECECRGPRIGPRGHGGCHVRIVHPWALVPCLPAARRVR